MHGYFVKIFVAPARMISETLPDREWAALTRLALWVYFRDNRLVTDRTLMTQAQIAEVIGKSLRQTKEILAELERRGLVRSWYVGRRKAYALSEQFCYRGGSPKERESPGVTTPKKATAKRRGGDR